MTTYAFNVVAPRLVVEELQRSVSAEGIEFSEMMPAESPADLLDSPVTGEEVRELLQLVTVVASSATAVLAFADRLLATLRKHKDTKVRLSDALSGDERGEVTATTSTESIRKMLSE